MQLYHTTAVPPSAVIAAVQGAFTAPRHQELVLATSTTLEIYRFYPKQAQLRPLFRTDLHASVRAISAFRLPGAKRHYLLLTSDAGTFTVLSADSNSRSFRRVHAEPFGRSAARPATPGQFLATDPHGRAALIASLTRPRLAYVLNRNADDALTISSPLDARASSHIISTVALTALDVGFENPLFAALERSSPLMVSENFQQREQEQQKQHQQRQHNPTNGVNEASNTTGQLEQNKVDNVKGLDEPLSAALALYELDLGLNSVVRKATTPLRDSANLVLPVPGAADGPGGALVCSEGWVSYFGTNPELDSSGSGDPTSSALVEARLPVREGTDPEVLIVSSTMYHDRKGSAFFFLLCTEHGDLFKVDLRAGPPAELRLAFFDSLPAPATAMVIFRAGYLFTALEGADSLLLKFQAVDVPDGEPGISTATGISSSTMISSIVSPPRPKDQMDLETHTRTGTLSSSAVAVRALDAPYDPRQPDPVRFGHGALARLFPKSTRLQRLAFVAQHASLAPTLAICAAGPRRNGLLLAVGRGRTGSLRFLRRGIGTVPLSTPHALPARARAVFALPRSAQDPTTNLLVVSFADRSRALAVSPDRVDETLSSGLELSAPTFVATLLGDDCIAQAHARGVRFLPAGVAESATEWKAPIPARVVAAAANSAQLVVALSSGAIVYFEFDEEKRALLEVAKLHQAVSSTDLTTLATVPSIAVMSVPPGRRRAPFVVVADATTRKVRIYRVTSDSSLESLGVHIAPAPVDSVALVDFSCAGTDGVIGRDGSSNTMRVPQLTLIIGTTAGAVVRLPVDPTTGAFGDKRALFLGIGPVRIRMLRIGLLPICLLLGKKPWLLHGAGARVAGGPLGCASMDDAAEFVADGETDGFVAVASSSLSLHALDLPYALQAASALPTAGPALGLPAPTSLAASFQTWESRIAGTPRRLIPLDLRDKDPSVFVVVETDHCASAESSMTEHGNGTCGRNSNHPVLPLVQIAPVGSWFSRLQLVRVTGGNSDVGPGVKIMEEEDLEPDAMDPLSQGGAQAVEILSSISLGKSEQCITAVTSNAAFGSEDGGDTVSYVVASISTHMRMNATVPLQTLPKSSGGKLRVTRGLNEGQDNTQNKKRNLENKSFGALVVYRVTKNLQLIRMHETRLGEPAVALTAFRDMVAAGVGAAVRLYALGKKQVLRKVECRSAVPRRVGTLTSAPGGDRLFVADCGASVTLLRYERDAIDKDDPGRLSAMAIEPLARWVTCLIALDHATVAVGDKFGSVAILRLPPEAGVVSGDADGASESSARLDVVASMHVGACVTSIAKAKLGGSTVASEKRSSGNELSTEDTADDAIVYATAAGAIGLLTPVRTAAQAKTLNRIEGAMRVCSTSASPTSRSHEAFRSMFYVRRAIIDGDLCEQFFTLSTPDRHAVAEKVHRTATDVARCVDEARAAAFLL